LTKQKASCTSNEINVDKNPEESSEDEDETQLILLYKPHLMKTMQMLLTQAKLTVFVKTKKRKS